jgi:hypothetical protein
MEDDYQITLKGKIKILYQLGKWHDVIKLVEQYNEKYGKDVEVDMMRFKSERRLSKTAPAEENKARITTPESQPQESSESLAAPEIVAKEEPPLLLTADHDAVKNPALLIMDEIPIADQPRLVEEKPEDEPFPEANDLIIVDQFAENTPKFSLDYNEPPSPVNELIITDSFADDKQVISQAAAEPSPIANELIITDPFAEDKQVISQAAAEPSPIANELIITDPFAENEPVFNLVNNEPPVILSDSDKAENISIQIEPRTEEIAIVEESPSKFVNPKSALDFKSNSAMAFDTEPTLAPPPAQKESIARQANVEEKKSSAESLMEMVDEKPYSLSETSSNLLKMTPPPKKNALNFKYFLLLMLPLIAAVILWLALSGKLNLNGGATEKVIPASVIKPQVPAAQKPLQKVAPAVKIPQIDEKEKLVNEKIDQANDFINDGDLLNALAVVREAKKIKMTEPLRLLEELITKKIREDESRAAEQEEDVQSMAQPEEQSYANAETENTLAAWQNFLVQYPHGELAALARKKIVVLQKKAAQKAEQELQLKIQQAQKLKLRSNYVELNQAELNTVLQQLGKPIAQFEQLEHSGEKVIIDFSSGLMWTLWNKPMGFDKAKWWANRIYAGYSGWRLPTVEESMLLLQMDKALYAGLADFAVWTGDGVSDQTRSIWALRLPQGQFIPEDYSQVYYVWAVRKAGK